MVQIAKPKSIKTHGKVADMKILLHRWFPVFALSAGFIIFIAGCTTVPVTGRRELNLVSSGQEVRLGLSSFGQLKTNTPSSNDPTINGMVQRVGKRVAAIASKDLREEHRELMVLDTKEAHA